MKKISFILILIFFTFLSLYYIKEVKASPLCDINITWSSNTTYTIDQSNTYYCLNQSWYLTVTAIQFALGTQNSTLDCLDYNIDSNDTSNTYGVYLSGSNVKNNTIRNCQITDFYSGIRIASSSNGNRIINNTIRYNSQNGIYITSSNYNLIENNTITDNTAVTGLIWGIRLEDSDFNNITGNTLDSNRRGILLEGGSMDNRIVNNTITNHVLNSIDIDGSSATLINNTINSNDLGIYFNYPQGSKDVTGGSIQNNNDYDVYLYTWGGNIKFRAIDGLNKIDFYDRCEDNNWFQYSNDTSDGIWLKTCVVGQYQKAINNRELTSWSQSLMQWNDSAWAITVRYSLTGLFPNRGYVIYNDSVPVYNLQTDSSGNLPSFTIYLSSEHQISVEAIDINVTTNQTSYLPGQTVLAYGTFYFGNGTGISNQNVTVTFKYPNGNTAQQRNVTTDANGKYNDTYTLATTAIGGTYSVNVTGYYDSLTAESSTTFKVLITTLTTSPITVKTYPEEIVPVVSISKLRALRNLTYEEIVRTLGTGYKFRIEISEN